MISKSPHNVTEEGELVNPGWGTDEAVEKNFKVFKWKLSGKAREGQAGKSWKSSYACRRHETCVLLTGRGDQREEMRLESWTVLLSGKAVLLCYNQMWPRLDTYMLTGHPSDVVCETASQYRPSPSKETIVFQCLSVSYKWVIEDSRLGKEGSSIDILSFHTDSFKIMWWVFYNVFFS